MKTSLRRVVEVAGGLALIAALLTWLSGGFADRVPAGKLEAAGRRAPPGSATAVVERVSGPAVEWASGGVASARHTVVASRILARIEEVRVRAGDEVAKRDIVVVLDARDLKARLAQAREALRAARAQRDLARTEKARAEELLRRGVGTRQRFDQAVSSLRVAEADVDRRRQILAEARTALSHTVIRSPVPGRVVDRLAEPGEIVAPGRPLLRIYDPNAMRVEAPVRESLAVRLGAGMTVRVRIPALGEELDGAIEEIVPFAEPGARTLLVKVRLPRDPRLFAGLFARIAVPAGARVRLVVPAHAVERIGQLEFATVVSAAGRLERRLVTTGAFGDKGRIEVLSGLAEGERVLLTPAGRRGADRPPAP